MLAPGSPGCGTRPLVGRTRRTPRLTLILAAAVFYTSLYATVPHALQLERLYRFVPPFEGYDRCMVDHLGAEHLCIVRALCAGRGYADPFQEKSGPTAWMAPVLPLIEAVPFALGGLPLTTIVVVVLQDCSLIFTGWLVLRTAAGSRWEQAPVVALVLFLATSWHYFLSCYQSTHDSWLLMIWVGVFLYASERLWRSRPTLQSCIGWGIAGGLGALSGPVLRMVWAALTVVLTRSTRRTAPFLLSGLLASLVLAPWTIRNGIVFGQFIPVKSNLFFELYQSNVLEPDGVLRSRTGDSHPYTGPGPERSRYQKMGEVAYLDDYRDRFLRELRGDPTGYAARVANRLLAATILYHPFLDGEGGLALIASYLVHPLPFYGLLLMLVTRGWTSDRVKVIALTVYLTYLIPYVLVAYYERYAMPLFGLHVVLVFWGLEAIQGLWIGQGGGGGKTPPRVEESSIAQP